MLKSILTHVPIIIRLNLCIFLPKKILLLRLKWKRIYGLEGHAVLLNNFNISNLNRK